MRYNYQNHVSLTFFMIIVEIVIILFLLLHIAGCGMTEEDYDCGDAESCWEQTKEKWSENREKAKDDYNEFADDWNKEADRRKKNGEDRQGATYDKDEAQGNYPESVEFNGLIKKGLTMDQTADILGIPDITQERLGGGKIWKWELDSGVCGNDHRFSKCAVFFDENYHVDYPSNISADFLEIQNE